MKSQQHDGGYVLVYVVVVIVILCLLVPAACANSLQNLKAQQASIERMQQLYQAEGQIERFVAEVLQVKVQGTCEADDESEAKAAARKDFTEKLKIFVSSCGSLSFSSPQDEPQDGEWEQYACEVKSKIENIDIIAQITVNLKIETVCQAEFVGSDAEGVTHYPYSYEITVCTITYDSYDISTAPEGGEGGPL